MSRRFAERTASRTSTVHIEDWQERILRGQYRKHTQEYLGKLCGRSRQWAAIALKTLDLKTKRQSGYSTKGLHND